MPSHPLKALLLAVALFAVAGGFALAGAQGGASWLGLPLIVWCLLWAFAVNWIAFVPAYLAQTEHYYDLTGSFCYVTLALFCLLMNPGDDPRTLMIGTLVLIWALRLGTFLFRRVKADGKDARFDELKPDLFKFLNVWSLQGLWVFLTLATALAAMTTARSVPLGWVAWLGLAIWALGFGIEAIADHQKRVWRRDPANKGGFISSGLWAWSQHPNYFGEILLWFGIALIALPALGGWQYLCLVSPFFVWLLLTRVSGIPLLDEQAKKRFAGNDDYWAYTRRTSKLLPLPPGD